MRDGSVGRQWRSSSASVVMDLNLGKRRSGGGGMSSSADRMASEVARAAASGGGTASGAGGQQSYELIKSTQVGTNTSLEIATVGLLDIN